MILYIKALVAGALCGAVFGIVKLPIPAPNAVAGLLGILGIFLGYRLATL